MKLKIPHPDWVKASGNEAYIFYCPGCGYEHIYYTKWGKPENGKPTWTFNGDLNKPTFSPSLLNHYENKVCHLFVTNGQIQYCGDSTHELAGKTVDMVDVKS